MGTRRERLTDRSFFDRRYLVAFGMAAVFAGLVLHSMPAVVGSGDVDPPPQARALLPTGPAATPTEASPTPTETPSPTPTPTQKATSRPPAALPRVTLDFPERGQRIPEDRDFVAGGTVRDLGDDDLRIFIFSEERRRHYLADYRAEKIGDNRWEIRSTGIGREWGREGDRYLVQVVRAGGRCQDKLDGLELGDDRYPAFDDLPDGCAVAAQVRIVEADTGRRG
ncbi:hypothetical protein [Spirillospora sp. NPDC047279]|uniref:hypothetical protein n=1 Tax=Spirillospora sp. NPDC047279 TaxID=3155478 RepID=UPI0034083044